MSKIPRSWRCRTCNTQHFFGAYVAAHTNVELVHSCECGARHTVLNYRITQIKAGTKPTEKTKR